MRMTLTLIILAASFSAKAAEPTPVLWNDIHLYDSRNKVEQMYATSSIKRDANGDPWTVSRGGMGQTVINGAISADCHTDVAVWFDTDGSEPGAPGEGGAIKVEIDFATELCARPWPSLAAQFGKPVYDRVYRIGDETFHAAVWRDGERLIELHDDEATLTFTAGRKMVL